VKNLYFLSSSIRKTQNPRRKVVRALVGRESAEDEAQAEGMGEFCWGNKKPEADGGFRFGGESNYLALT
jgi:hypothetical protein